MIDSYVEHRRERIRAEQLERQLQAHSKGRGRYMRRDVTGRVAFRGKNLQRKDRTPTFETRAASTRPRDEMR